MKSTFPRIYEVRENELEPADKLLLAIFSECSWRGCKRKRPIRSSGWLVAWWRETRKDDGIPMLFCPIHRKLIMAE